jgi:type III pantothenate kinase
MMLAIDIGNTNTVFAVFDTNGVMNDSWRCRSDTQRAGDEYASFLAPLLDLIALKFSDIKHILVSSVVPDANFQIRSFGKKYCAIDPVFVTKDMTGLNIDLPNPDEVGLDRLVNAAAVMAHYRAPAIILDFGTATTFDVIGAGGIYKGGVIAPGINLSMAALAQAASKLPKVSIQKPDHVIGRNTTSAMQSGLYWGYVGLIEGLLRRLCDEMGGQKPFILATGGLATIFIQDITMIETSDKDLTLKGLYHIFQKNKKSH